MANTNLANAKKTKNDEFYTQLEDIEYQLNNFKDKFINKVVYCNCDNPEYSKFWEYFHKNFKKLGIKKLIATFYSLSERPFKTEYSGGNDEDIKLGDKTYLKFNGDFRSFECVKILDECDVVVTNPPFSLFRDFISLVVSRKNKEILVIGNMNAITYKEVFVLIKNNKLWLGEDFKGGNAYFSLPNNSKTDYANGVFDKNTGLVKFRNCCWFTNIDLPKRHKPLDLIEKYSPEKYPKYDNYDVINVDKILNIPFDYNGIIGVPITFLDKYNPDQFEILGDSQRGCHDESMETRKYNDFWEVRQDGTKTGSSGNKTNGNPNLRKNDGKHNFFTNDKGEEIQSCYNRIFIRRKR